MDLHTLGLTALGGLLLFAGGLVGTYFRNGPKGGQKAAAIYDAMVGTAEVTDNSGTVIREGQPGLIAVSRATLERLDRVEENLVNITTVLTEQRQLASRVDDHDLRFEDVDTTIAALIASKWEAGALAALQAAEQANKDVLDVNPEET